MDERHSYRVELVRLGTWRAPRDSVFDIATTFIELLSDRIDIVEVDAFARSRFDLLCAHEVAAGCRTRFRNEALGGIFPGITRLRLRRRHRGRSDPKRKGSS